MLGTIWVSAQRGSHVPEKKYTLTEQQVIDLANEKHKMAQEIALLDSIRITQATIIARQDSLLQIKDSIGYEKQVQLESMTRTAGLNLGEAHIYKYALESCKKDVRKQKLTKWLTFVGGIALGAAAGVTGTILLK